MSDQLTLQVQKMERQYEDLKKYFASDGKATPAEEQTLKDVRAKIDALRQKALARAAQFATHGGSMKVETSGKVSGEAGKGTKATVGVEIKGSVERTVVQTGDSIQVTEKRTSGAGVNVKAGGVGGSFGTTNSHEKSTKVTGNDKGTLDVDTKSTDTRETNRSGSVSLGVAGMEVGATHTKKTSFGYSINVDIKQDPDGKIREWLGRCTSPQDYQVFLAANAGKVSLTGQSTGKGTADATSIGVSIGPAKASIGTNQGVEEETITDAKGRLVKKTVVGTAGAGGKALWHSDSVQEEAVAEIDGKGKASVTLTRTKTDGAVDKSGRRLSNEDLKRIGGIACRGTWMSAVTLRPDEKDDWRTAGEAIARAKGAPSVVAEQLARFVGGDRVERWKTVQKFLRGGSGGQGAIGQTFEFPDAIKRLQASYEVVTAASLPKELERIAASNPAAAVDKCKGLLAIVDLLEPQIRKNEDFDNKATKMEMLQRLVLRRQMIAEAVKGFGGQRKPEEDPALLQQAADRLQKQLTSFSVEQARVGAKLYELLKGQPKFRVQDLGDAKELIRQLDDMHRRWRTDYGAMKDTMSKRGVPSWNMPTLEPDQAMLARYEKAAGI